MNLLVIAPYFPMPDRMGADNRFVAVLKLLVDEHRVTFVAHGPDKQVARYGKGIVEGYRSALEQLGVAIAGPAWRPSLAGGQFDAVMLQYCFDGLQMIRDIRAFQPRSRILVDNGDVAYRRLLSKAELTGNSQDVAAARQKKAEELAVYRAVDAILAVSQEDLDSVRQDIPNLRAFMVPNIHPIPGPATVARASDRIVFVGSFLHEPNVDAVIWFVNEVLPLILAAVPGVKFQIVGYGPPPEVAALASAHVDVVGHVPSTAPYLESATVSVAPLRFGAGVKGKIGEAMAHRLPVVTTGIGVEGFGLTPGVNVLVGDSADAFARHVVRLLQEPGAREQIADAGFRFICDNFSEQAVHHQVREMMAALPSLPVRRAPVTATWPILLDQWLDRHVRWRLGSRRAAP